MASEETPAPVDGPRGTGPNGAPDLAATGIAGFDTVLNGGLPAHHTYLVQGGHGAGKTTLGLQFCLAGARQGERVLYLSTCETVEEIRQIASSHGWTLEGVQLEYYNAVAVMGDFSSQSVFHPAEIELPKTLETILSAIDRVNPQRLVLDSLSEIRLLAGEPRWFRRQLLALRERLTKLRCTTLLCGEITSSDQSVQSIVHGVIELEQQATSFGPDQRRLRVLKVRGHQYQSGYHDFRIRPGGLEVYPRLVAAEHRRSFAADVVPSGLASLDSMLGGGADRGTATLLFGPAGTGKSNIACQFVSACAERGERAAMYVFDERVQTLLARTENLGLDLAGHTERGVLDIRQVDPAELTLGEFTHSLRQTVSEEGTRLVVIDSLAGFVHSMPDARSITLHLHELLAFLSQQEVTILLVMAQHGMPGTARDAPFDLSYIADSVLLFHCFEHAGEMRRAISVYKRRGGKHETTLRELEFGPAGIRIGEPLRQFRGILTGAPTFEGDARFNGQLRDQD